MIFYSPVDCEPELLFALGQFYFSHQDYARALKYFEKAAGVRVEGRRKFSSQAKYQLGVMYYDGLGVKEDLVSQTSPSPYSYVHRRDLFLEKKFFFNAKAIM